MNELKIGQRVRILKRSENSGNMNEIGKGVITGFSYGRGSEQKYIWYRDAEWIKDGILNFQELIAINAPSIKVVRF